MKIGIITCFDMKNVNFGNRLQAYALNSYINKTFRMYENVQTLYFQDFKDFKRTKNEPFIDRCKRKIKRDFICKNEKGIPTILNKRLEKFNEFSKKNIKLVNYPLSKEELYKQDFDVYIVGSDVVWYQWNYGIRPIKLLDFKTIKDFKKVSYAASFGNDFIPQENVKELKRCFRSFSSISVREKSSIDIMKKIGINNAKHVMDPTLLLDTNEWIKMECEIYNANILKKGGYIFVYLLNSQSKDRKEIVRIANKMKLNIVTVPYASGKKNTEDDNFGDYQIMDCDPGEWLWLIHNATYVITDSFHGSVFSAKYHTKFIVTKRKEQFEMNNRMKDFLKTIKQEDKFVDLATISTIENYNWNFKEIDNILTEKIEDSKKYLEEALL